MTWSDITLKQFYEIKDILSIEDDWTYLNLIDCIYGVDCQNLPISELKKYNIEFIKDPIPKVKLEKFYTINGTKYNSNCDLTKVTVAQFIDYQNYLKETEPKLEKLLSVFFIPEGYKDYNTDYDIIQVQKDLLDLPIDVAQSIGFFFSQQLHLFVILFPYSLINQVKKMKLEKKKKKEVIARIKQMKSFNSELYHTLLNTAK